MDELIGHDLADISQVAESETAPLLCVVVPTFNERGNILPLYERLSQVLAGMHWELIFVDDDSPDRTAEEAKRLARAQDNVRCLHRVGRRGLSSACIEGISAATAPFVAVMDADMQHDESILPQMLVRAEQGDDLVVGSRYLKGGSADGGFSRTRKTGSAFATWLAGLVTPIKITDPMSGYFLMRRDVFDRLASQLAPDGFKILLDILVCANSEAKPLKVSEIAYQFRARRAGDSKMSNIIGLQFAGLWLSKLSGGLLPPSFLLFAMVGASGIGVHMFMLAAGYYGLGLPFLVAQVLATLVAMTSNFFFNNILTYRDKRLHGRKMLLGLLSFYVVCSIGAVANVSFASVIYRLTPGPFIAGFAGAIMSSVFNYAVTRVYTWR